MDTYDLTDEQLAHIEKIVRSRIRLCSDYPALLDASLRFTKSLYGKHSDRVTTDELNYNTEPEDLLKVHSYVMNAKSARCQTLKQLANSVIRQAELPMCKAGRFRGEDYRVDWGKAWDKWGNQK